MGKFSLLTGAAIGYVLGTRAGRRRYLQIKRVSNRVWTSNLVENRKTDLKIAMKSKAAPFVADRVSDAAKATANRLRDSATREPKRLRDVTPDEPVSPNDVIHPTRVDEGPGEA
ncbi:MAG: hypothetical protein ACK5MP_06395 [Nostocoides sp.]